MTEEWGPWIEHDGKGCPCRGEIVEAIWRHRDGRTYNYIEGESSVWLVPPDAGSNPRSSSWIWRLVNGLPHPMPGGNSAPIIRYRIRKPRGLTILEGLLENLPEQVDA